MVVEQLYFGYNYGRCWWVHCAHIVFSALAFDSGCKCKPMIGEALFLCDVGVNHSQQIGTWGVFVMIIFTEMTVLWLIAVRLTLLHSQWCPWFLSSHHDQTRCFSNHVLTCSLVFLKQWSFLHAWSSRVTLWC